MCEMKEGKAPAGMTAEAFSCPAIWWVWSATALAQELPSIRTKKEPGPESLG